MIRLKDLNAHWKRPYKNWKALTKLCFECFVKCFTLNQRVAVWDSILCNSRMRAASLDFFSHEIRNWSLDHIMFVVRLVLYFISRPAGQPANHIFIITNSTILLSIEPSVLFNKFIRFFFKHRTKKFLTIFFFFYKMPFILLQISIHIRNQHQLRTVNYYYYNSLT